MRLLGFHATAALYSSIGYHSVFKQITKQQTTESDNTDTEEENHRTSRKVAR